MHGYIETCVKSLFIVADQRGKGKFRGTYPFPSQSNVVHFHAVVGKNDAKL